MQKTIFWCTYFEFFSCNDHAVKLQDHGMGCELELYAEGHGTCNGVIIKKVYIISLILFLFLPSDYTTAI